LKDGGGGRDGRGGVSLCALRDVDGSGTWGIQRCWWRRIGRGVEGISRGARFARTEAGGLRMEASNSCC